MWQSKTKQYHVVKWKENKTELYYFQFRMEGVCEQEYSSLATHP